MKKKYIIWCLVALSSSITWAQDSNKQLKSKDDWLTIVIHGTIMPHISLQNIIKIIYDNIEYTTYKLTTEFIRNDPLFYHNQPMQELGLHKIDKKHPATPKAAITFAKLIDEAEQPNCKKQINNHLYYTYGWSGLVSCSHRLKESYTFYQELAQELKLLRDKGINPRVRIIAYSHGGNIALNLAAVQKKYSLQADISIDELILIGVPIQKTTDYLINDSIFKRIYHIYSLSDRVQRLDFANRRFLPRRNFELPDKLTQLKLQLHGIKSKYKSGYRKKRIDPGHIELWFFGWTSTLYRKHFPLWPLPITIFIPWIINEIEQHCNTKDSLIVDIDLPNDQLTIQNYKSRDRKHKKAVPFIPLDKIEDFKQQAQQIMPDKKEYNKQMHLNRKRWAQIQAHYYRRKWLKKRANQK